MRNNASLAQAAEPHWIFQYSLTAPCRAFVAACLCLALVGTATGLFARWYHEQRHARASHEFELGEQQTANGRPAEALDYYRAALSLDRDNRMYRRAVAVSLVQLQRFPEAERHLAELLERNPVDAEANLLRARLAARRGAARDAEAYYQRAIYGRWDGADEPAQRLAARFEMLTWLEQSGARVRARAELVRLQAEAPDVPTVQRALARHFLMLGDPLEAADILQGELRRHPRDADAARALIEAQLSATHLEEARAAARRAVALDPTDATSRHRLQELTDALAIDPTARRLSTAERERRSRELLMRVVAAVEQCDISTHVPASTAQSDAIDRVRVLVDPRVRSASGTLLEDRLTAAQALWAFRGTCGNDETLGWILDRIGRD